MFSAIICSCDVSEPSFITLSKVRTAISDFSICPAPPTLTPGVVISTLAASAVLPERDQDALLRTINAFLDAARRSHSFSGNEHLFFTFGG